MRNTPHQWPNVVRTTICIAAPAVVGWALGDLSAGLLASLGGFTGLFGGRRPYLNRARLLFAVAVCMSICVGLGIWAGADRWLGVAVVTVIAALATWVCNAFSIQPGAYQIALACATGTALHAQSADLVQTSLLVLAGGIFACLVQLSPAVMDRHGPEREAISEAGFAVADFLDALGGPEADLRQHEAAVAMHDAWVRLVNQQPQRRHPGNGLLRLREISRQLQFLLADGMRRRQPDTASATKARRLAGQALRRVAPDTRVVLHALPLGRPSGLEIMRNAVQPSSRSLLVIIRVTVAAAISGSLGLALGLTHSYWAIAASVLVLSQGFDQRRTLQRGLERTAGTVVGVGLVAGILTLGPSGPMLIALISLAVFCGQLMITRNYVSAAVFITCSALLMSGAGLPPDDAWALVWARGVDTALGCAVAIAVFVLLSRKSPDAWLPTALADTVDAAATAVDQLVPATITSWPALVARRDLQRRVLTLSETYENAINGFEPQRMAAERIWPVVVATERLAYRVLAEGWRLQQAVATTRSLQVHSDVSHPPSVGLRGLAEAIRAGRSTRAVTGDVPSFLSRDVGDLRRISGWESGQALRR
ncbi:MAG: FUSC family protein [Propionibacteriaceae bacterium]